MINWSEAYSVKVPQFDDEHRTLFKAINDFYEGLKQNAPSESLEKLINRLLDYAGTHFSNEEQYMQSIGYPNLEQHKNEHRVFIQKANEFYTKITEGKMVVSLEVTSFIKNWITTHIKTEDKKYAAFKQ